MMERYSAELYACKAHPISICQSLHSRISSSEFGPDTAKDVGTFDPWLVQVNKRGMQTVSAICLLLVYGVDVHSVPWLMILNGSTSRQVCCKRCKISCSEDSVKRSALSVVRSRLRSAPTADDVEWEGCCSPRLRGMYSAGGQVL